MNKYFCSVFALIALSFGLGALRIVNRQAGFAADQVSVWQCWDDGSPDPCHQHLQSVFMFSATDGWAVGYYGTVLHWNGSAWTKVTSPTTYDLYSIAMVSATDGWAMGKNGTILHWNGSAWTKVTSPTTYDLRSIAMVSATDGWAV